MATTQHELQGMPLPWGPDDTERYLADFPLPADFTWRGKAVHPQYRLKKGYGFWLRTTPYHPGLFEELNKFLARCDPLPSPEQMADAMRALEQAAQAEQQHFQL